MRPRILDDAEVPLAGLLDLAVWISALARVVSEGCP